MIEADGYGCTRVLTQERHLSRRFENEVQPYYYQSAKKLHRFYILKHVINSFMESLTASSHLTFESTKHPRCKHPQPATLPKVTLLHGCFSRFLNRANGTKLRKASHLLINIASLLVSINC